MAMTFGNSRFPEEGSSLGTATQTQTSKTCEPSLRSRGTLQTRVVLPFGVVIDKHTNTPEKRTTEP